MSKIRKTLSIDPEDEKYLNAHPEINLSGLLRKAIRLYREGKLED